MPRFAHIAVNIAGVKDLFDYCLPAQWEQTLGAGWLVEVPFGSQRVQGVIVSVSDTSQVPSPLPIAAILEEDAVLTPAQLRLGRWLADTYFTPIAMFLFAMLPPGLGQRSDTLYRLHPSLVVDPENLSNLQKRILQAFQKESGLRGRQLDSAFRHTDWRAAMRSLVRKGFVQSQPLLRKPSIKKKYIRTVQLKIGRQEIDGLGDSIGRAGSAARQRRLDILHFLAEEDCSVDVSWIYASSGATSADLHFLEKKGWLVSEMQEVMRDPLAGRQAAATTAPTLSPHQEKAWQVIQRSLKNSEAGLPLLIHGVTGSGKTELYLRTIQAVLQAGKQAIVLVPEISLTPQTIQRFMERFPQQVGVVHSHLSAGERYDTWRRARAGDFSIVIGARSALFTPFPNLGVIVIDECHDDSFYQTEMGPYYYAVQAAIAYGKINACAVLLGSATPSVQQYFQAQYQNWPIIELPQRVLAHSEYFSKRETIDEEPKARDLAMKESGILPLPEVQVVDMREELKAGNTSIFSRALQEKLEGVLSERQQAILLLNRRGSATFIFCRDCGFSLRCPRCDFPLTYHRGSASLVCHTCGYSRNLPKKCPRCASTRIRQFGLGTEKLEEELQRRFSHARILRWDADTSKGKGAQEIILSHFKQHNADILLGTQMLAKSLDLPLVTLVGVVLADVGLNFPDYRTSERAFQLFTQVAGRAGRSQLGGDVVLQTFQPEHNAIQFAAQHDFKGFYQHELELRRRLRYPPFVQMVRFEVCELSNEKARQRAQALAGRLKVLISQAADKSLTISEPLPPYFAKRSGYYRWQIVLKGSQPETILKGQAFDDISVEVDPPSLL